MKAPRRPVTDHFGTRLDPRELVEGLRRLGPHPFSLALEDDGLLLNAAAGEGAADFAERASTWLRGLFSPLFPCRTRTLPPARLGPVFEDRRRRRLETVFLTEVFGGEAERDRALAGLLARLGTTSRETAVLRIEDWDSAPEEFRRRLKDAARGTVVLSWQRPGGPHGARTAEILAASDSPEALLWLVEALGEDAEVPARPFDVLLDGLEWGVARRPTVARPGVPASSPILVDPGRCRACGLCAKVCPADCFAAKGRFAAGGAARCLGCFDCVEACPQDALRPRYGDSSALHCRALKGRPGWLSRLRGAPGPAAPSPFPPSFLLPRAGRTKGSPRWILGLAAATQQEHAAALLENGRLAGAVEEERFSRVRHHGWKSARRPGAHLACDPTLCLEEVLPRRAIGALLSPRGLTLDDLDLLAVNGIPARYRRAYSAQDGTRPLPTLRSGRLLFLPHHLCHAASAWRLSGQKESWVLTVDGRGDRETAAVFRGERGRLRQVREVLSLGDRSIGGVYETLTRLLGFGTHGQGSVMALASFGKPSFDLGRFLCVRPDGTLIVHESGLAERFAALAREPGAPLRRAHKDLAASLQESLELILIALLETSGVSRGAALCLAGGVALNCRANARIRRTLRPREMFVQPGANDAGTALGAALEAAALEGLPAPPPLKSAALGPSFSEEEAAAALAHAGLDFRRSAGLAREAAELLASGKVVCWCQGAMEFGPRALGGRSILADPRRAGMHAKVNRIKEREPWRPFGPSILAGHEKEWFAEAFDSRFMLFTLPLKASRRRRTPAVAHVDGTSRPQSVHRDEQPLYHALLSEFHRRTGVPMLLNTSFNRRGEPIVCSPADAAACFLGMPEADVLIVGPFIARRPTAPARPARAEDLAALPGGRRLMLRLSARCDDDCAHCTIRDLEGRADRSFADALRALEAGRRASCSELVVMRGEASRWPGIEDLLRRARAMGYSWIQLQTHARRLTPGMLELVDAFEATVFSADERVHDALAGRTGALRRTLAGLLAARAAGREVLLNVPVLRRNRGGLASVARLAAKLGARRLQFGFPRPVETREGLETAELLRLAEAAPLIRAALRAARAAGVESATEGVPFCALDAFDRRGPDAGREWSRFRVDDLGRLQEELDPRRSETRPQAPACRGCRAHADCPRTWALYLTLFGSSELRRL